VRDLPSAFQRPQHLDARWCCHHPWWRLSGVTEHARKRSARGAGDLWLNLGLVFPNMLGRHMEPRDLLANVYRPLLDRAGLPPVTFHTLRHTAATLLLSEGEHPKVVQELLGHAQISITLDRYSHMTPRLMSNAAAVMDRLLDEEA
jgi:integrase